MKKLSKKAKIITIVGALVLISVCAVGITLALLRDKPDPVKNDFKGAAVNIGIVENEKVYENASKDGGNINSSFSVIEKDKLASKSVKIQNIDDPSYATSDTYVRVRLIPVFRDKNGDVAPISINEGDLVYNGNNKFGEDWLVVGTGTEACYYYKKPLAKGKITSELITSVTYKKDVPEEVTFELQVLAEGVSAKQKDSLADVWTDVKVDKDGKLIKSK